MGSADEKLISLETARHLRIFVGTLASCSTSGTDLLRNKQSIKIHVTSETLTNRRCPAKEFSQYRRLASSSNCCNGKHK